MMMRGDCEKGWLSLWAPKCSSFTSVNSGTSSRSACTAIGNCEFSSVRDGNCLGSRNFESNDHQHEPFYGYVKNIFWVYWDETGISENMIPGSEDVPIDYGGSMSQCHIHIGTTFLELL